MYTHAHSAMAHIFFPGKNQPVGASAPPSSPPALPAPPGIQPCLGDGVGHRHRQASDVPQPPGPGACQTLHCGYLPRWDPPTERDPAAKRDPTAERDPAFPARRDGVLRGSGRVLQPGEGAGS